MSTTIEIDCTTGEIVTRKEHAHERAGRNVALANNAALDAALSQRAIHLTVVKEKILTDPTFSALVQLLGIIIEDKESNDKSVG